MEDENDWRYSNLESLRGSTFELRTWKMESPEWDHEHCVGCWQEIAEAGKPLEVIHDAYVTEYDDWICPGCFDTFHDMLQFRVVKRT